MLKQVITLLAIATVAVSAFAQSKSNDASTISTSVPSVMSAKGFRVALVKSFLDYEQREEYLGNTTKAEGGFKNEAGLSVGYAFLPVQKLGFTANFTYLTLDEEDAYKYDDTFRMIRIDGNLAYSINEILSVKGGLNISDFSNSDLDNLDPSIGLQFGGGVQITKNFGADISYVVMQQFNKVRTLFGESEFRVFERGLEVALHATF